MQSDKLQQRIDAYLAELRRCLGELPPQEVHDILQEIRGHIFERAEASGELTEDRVAAALKALGRPDEIARSPRWTPSWRRGGRASPPGSSCAAFTAGRW